jgi:hypothetical protein
MKLKKEKPTKLIKPIQLYLKKNITDVQWHIRENKAYTKFNCDSMLKTSAYTSQEKRFRIKGVTDLGMS